MLERERVMLRHVGEARFVWNLALDQVNQWRPGRKPLPSSTERFRELTEARHGSWLGEGSSTIQQQALRDLDQALKNWWRGSHRRPTWRKRGENAGFCVRDVSVRILSRRWAEIHIPKCGPVRFRLSRPIPEKIGMARVTLDAAGRWHVSLTATPSKVPHEPTGTWVGLDRGVINTITTSEGEFLHTPNLRPKEAERLLRLQRHLARQHKGSGRRKRTKRLIGQMRARERDRRKDFVEKTTTNLARKNDVIVIEKLNVKAMSKSARGTIESPGRNVRQKVGLNRAIRSQSWGMFAIRLHDKAAQRGTALIEVPSQYTSTTCRICGYRAAENRESQAIFKCLGCGHTEHADVHAARFILELGKLRQDIAVAARGALANRPAMNREPTKAT